MPNNNNNDHRPSIGRITEKYTDNSTFLIQPWKFVKYLSDRNTYLITIDSRASPIELKRKHTKEIITQPSNLPNTRELLSPIDQPSIQHLRPTIHHSPTSIQPELLRQNEHTLISNQVTVFINQDPSNDFWLNKWINDATIKEDLNALRKLVSSSSNLTFYTDGSLKNEYHNNLRHLSIDERYETIQSAAFYETTHNIKFTSRISQWPSSTRAELWAILLTLLISPQNC